MSMKQEYEIGSEARNLYVVGKMNLWDYQDTGMEDKEM